MKKNSKYISMINNKRLLDTFIGLLSIKSPSRNEKEIVGFVSKRLKKLGLKVEIDKTGNKTGSNSGNIIAYIPATDKSKRTPIFLGAHLDTVSVDGDIIPVTKKGKVINKNRASILGGDDKVAIASILEALEVIVEKDIPVGDIYIIFTVAEEIAILGAKYVDLKKIKADYGFVFDGEGDIGVINNEAPYQNTMQITVHGIAAHAGIEPEKGLNSIKIASEAISRIKTGRIDKETTCNIGVIEGGVAINIVPQKTMIKAEARSLKPKKLEAVTKKMTDHFRRAADLSGAKIDIKIEREYDGFKIGEDELPIIIGSKAIENLGRTPKIESTGGGSDINIFNAKGKIAINFSSAMENVHTKNEFVKIKELQILPALVLEIATSEFLKNR